jgi:hypothetical protein
MTSARESQIKATAQNSASAKSNVMVSQTRSQITQLRAKIYNVDTQIRYKKEEISNTQESGGTVTAQQTADLAALQNTRAGYVNQLRQLSAQEADNLSSNTLSALTALATQAPPGTSVWTMQSLLNPSNNFEYNVSGVLESYYSPRDKFLEVAKFSSNKPSVVSSAEELWTSAKASKGMLVSYLPPTEDTSYRTGDNPETATPFFGKNYGFQFMYNPSQISMNYTGAPNVDVAMQASGTEKFNLMGTSATQSTISFQILINRMFDMKYYEPDGKGSGKLKGGGGRAYGARVPSLPEQNAIYDMGTMYDVEYLLRTLLGYTLKSYLRNGQTADMGYLGARPVELHLGKSLRYLGTVTSISLDHRIFNERMVPLFTNVGISFSRIPDYPIATKNK